MTTLNNPVVTSQLLSHQTGLSVTPSAANTLYNLGNSITIPRNGIIKITMATHTNGYSGLALQLTRGSATYLLGGSSATTESLVGNNSGAGANVNYIFGNSPTMSNIMASVNPNTMDPSYPSYSPFTLELLVLSGDVLQFQGDVSAAGDTVYLDDLVVILQ